MMRVIPDKPPSVVGEAFFSICQLQRPSVGDICIQTLDLKFATAELLKVGNCILCLLASEKLPLELSF